MPRLKKEVIRENEKKDFNVELEKDKAQPYKKNGPQSVTYEKLEVQRDGKKIIKVREVKKYNGVTEQQLVYQTTNGKQVAGYMSKDDLIKKGVKL